MSGITDNNYPVRCPSSILNTLYFGSQYFKKVYNLASYLGSGQVALDGAEILFQLVLRKNKSYISREYISEYLCMDIQKINKAISFLRKLKLVKSHDKGYLLIPSVPNNKDWTNDETFEYYNTLHSLDFDGSLDKIWDLMSLIYTIKDYPGLGIPECSRRHFIVCLCMGYPFDCSRPKAKQVCEVLFNLDLAKIGNQYSIDDYRGKIEKYQEWRTNRNRCLSVYQKAKLLLIRPDWWGKVKPWFIPQKAFDVVEKARQYFPRNNRENLRDTLNKWNLFCYEYIVHHPTTGDYDFNPCSPFYGLSLEERLELLPKTIGTDSEIYQRGYLTQSQWNGVFNDEETDFLKHEFPKERMAIINESRKWERERKKKR